MSDFSPFNKRVLVSDAEHLAVKGINAYENKTDQPDVAAGIVEHQTAVSAFVEAGVKVEHVKSPPECQDGVFTANWALTWNGRALMSRLPNMRQAEQPYADEVLKGLGFETRPASVLFSGQGDALPIGGDRVIMGNGYRTDPAVAREVKEWLGLEPIIVRAKPKRHWYGAPVRNQVSNLWDSYYYDIDLAVAVIRPDLLAVCFGALTREGKMAIDGLHGVEIIPVDTREARHGLACNLVSTGERVVMIDEAPKLAEALASRGLEITTLPNHELRKGGGGFRCISLSLYD